jgi:putative acetyltransferase
VATADEISIRPETPSDTPAVRAVLLAAFAGDAEAELVGRLRSDNALVAALIAEEGGRVVIGYIAFPRLTVEIGTAVEPAIGLAPLAVAPTQQGHGVGSALARVGLTQLAARGERIVFVLGAPAYYGRFGFSVDAAAPFASRYAGPHFMALPLSGDAPRAGRVRYPLAFDQLA